MPTKWLQERPNGSTQGPSNVIPGSFLDEREEERIEKREEKEKEESGIRYLKGRRRRGRRAVRSREQLLYRTVQWFRGGLVFEAHRLLWGPSPERVATAGAACFAFERRSRGRMLLANKIYNGFYSLYRPFSHLLDFHHKKRSYLKGRRRRARRAVRSRGVRGRGCCLRGAERSVNRFRGGLVFKAHRLVYHSV